MHPSDNGSHENLTAKSAKPSLVWPAFVFRHGSASRFFIQQPLCLLAARAGRWLVTRRAQDGPPKPPVVLARGPAVLPPLPLAPLKLPRPVAEPSYLLASL